MAFLSLQILQIMKLQMPPGMEAFGNLATTPIGEVQHESPKFQQIIPIKKARSFFHCFQEASYDLIAILPVQ